METVTNKFLRYIKINTQSDQHSATCPSSPCQLDLGKLLVEELNALQLKDVSLDENGYVMATIPANISEAAPVIGFIAHMDTSPDISGDNVQPQLIAPYDGQTIILNEGSGISLSPEEFPELLHYVGQTLIVTDGTTLLGADDKAGIAEIMTAIDYLQHHAEIPHGDIRIAFTPDEELGRGADHFDVEKFAADWAYTVDGGPIGELEYENFNAAGANILVHGRNVHPGTAKNIMLNSMVIAMELNSMLPVQERPEHTEGYEGFYFLTQMIGEVEQTKLTYIIRDHDWDLFEERKEMLLSIIRFLNEKYGENTVQIYMRDQYYNMKQQIEPVMHVVKLAKAAMLEAGVSPKITPIRGGTDGARLSYMNLPCPNLFTGGHNFHGKYEFVCVESMEKSAEVIVNIARLSTRTDY